MITGRQIRAARALLGWDQATLAERSRVSQSTIRRGELAEGVPTMRGDNLAALQRAFEDAGVIFLEPGDVRPGGYGVRLRRR